MVDNKTFYMGLTMAGAISAGAYTAGVFDFLTEALDLWDKRKNDLKALKTPSNEWDVPAHDVVIPVISGASAGSITAAVGLVALADAAESGRAHRSDPDHAQTVGEVTTTLRRLYDTWVKRPKFIDKEGKHFLLGSADLAAGKLTSALDGTLLDDIVRDSISGVQELAKPRAFLSGSLHLYFTETNTRGVPYDIGFTGGLPRQQPGYPMMCYGDRVHYRVSGVGTATFSSKWAGPDPSRDISVEGLRGGEPNEAWKTFAETALGSGAFPIGLPARTIVGVDATEYQRRQWPIKRFTDDAGTRQRWFRLPPVDDFAAQSGDYVAVDGGVVNNEPFELARWTLLANPPDRNERNGDTADRAVVMIDPFPEPEDYRAAAALDRTLVTIAKRILPALKNQARFKPDELADALDEDIYSRFLIAPRRKQAPDAPVEKYAIACGLLQGFGGFLSESFRAHDYQLGRLNCYLFLRDSFALPVNNPIIKSGYGANARRSSYRPADAQTEMYQIIPLYGTAAIPPQPPNWPRITNADVETFVEKCKVRATQVVKELTSQSSSVILRVLLSAAWWWVGDSMIDKFVRYTLLKELTLRDQLEGPSARSQDCERQVLAALADPKYDYRTVAGIADEYHLPAEVVTAVLNNYASQIYEQRNTRRRASTYTLKSRGPGWLAQLPLVKHVGELWSGEPVIG